MPASRLDQQRHPLKRERAPRNGTDINTRTRSNGGRGQVAPCQLRAAGRPSHACAHVALTHAHTHAQAGDQATTPNTGYHQTRPDRGHQQPPDATRSLLHRLRSSFIHGTCMRLQARPVPLGHDMTSSRFAGELVSSRRQSQRLPENPRSPSPNKHPTNPTTPHLTSPRLASPRSSAPRPQPATFVFPDSVPPRAVSWSRAGPVPRVRPAPPSRSSSVVTCHNLDACFFFPAGPVLALAPLVQRSRSAAVTRRSAVCILLLIHQDTKDRPKTTKHAATTASPQYLTCTYYTDCYGTSLRTARRPPTAHLSQLKLPNPLQQHLHPPSPSKPPHPDNPVLYCPTRITAQRNLASLLVAVTPSTVLAPHCPPVRARSTRHSF